MDVLMAPGTELRRSGEIHVLQGQFHSGWTMTVNADHPAVRAQQREFRRRMVEVRQFVPLHRCVTRLATRERAVRPLGLHLRAEFATMYILVADRTSHIIKFVLHRSHRALRDFLVAVRTGDRYVGAGQRETCFLVFGQCEHRRTPTLIFQIVACLTAIQGRGCGELSLMNVFVTILALRGRNLEIRVLAFGAFGYMALVASDWNVDAFQRIFCGSMFFYTECGGRPIIYRMA